MHIRHTFLFSLMLLAIVATSAIAQDVSWWTPEDPEAGDAITIYYDTDPGILPPGNIKLHWGINSWTEPPESMWPGGTQVADPGQSVQTPLVFDSGTVWKVTIQTDMSVDQLDYVFTNGTSWENNGGMDWHIYLGEPPLMHWQRFTLDTRSANLGYTLEDLGDVVWIKGDFNGWSEIEMHGPDSRGVFWYDALLMDGAEYGYKFNTPSGIWMQDPDNPLTDGSLFNNSLAVGEAVTEPYYYGARPWAGRVYEQGEALTLHATVYPGDDASSLVTASLDVLGTDNDSYEYNPDTGEITGSVFGLSAGVHTVEISLEDDNGSSTTDSWTFTVRPDNYFMVGDNADDATGPGSYTADTPAALDLRGLQLLEAQGGDAMQIKVYLSEINDQSRVALQISSDIAGSAMDNTEFETELATPDFDGIGVQLVLADPGAPGFDDAVHNRLMTGNDPVSFGASFDVTVTSGANGDLFTLTIPLADLEAVLGSYGGDWYYGAYSFLGAGQAQGWTHEITEADGGIDELFDPDVYDALFMDSDYLQQVVLGNFTANKLATLDAEGRGFMAISPDEIGPNIGSAGPVVRFVTRDWETVWPEKLLYANVQSAGAQVTLNHQWDGGSTNYTLGTQSGDFTYTVDLEPGINTFQLEAEEGGETGTSPVLTIDHIVPIAPEAVMYSNDDAGVIYLNAELSTDPQDQAIDFLWQADPQNPSEVDLANANTANAAFGVPDIAGEYFFDLTLEDPDGNVTNARHLVDVHESGYIEHFDLDQTANWVRDAIVYEIYVRSYDESESLDAITADMDRIADMGYNCIWMMPIHPGPSTHGYAITDYYGIEEDYGTHEDLEELIEAAHERGIKVVLDMVINHSAVEHPWMQDAFALGEASNTYDWYDRDANGDYTYYYDWASLPNLNYNNMDVHHYLIEMSKWWIENYDIDGYRCDVAWGPQERNPEFWVKWRDALKTIKPEAWLLGEASASDFAILNGRFDSAYDWALHHEGLDNFQSLFTGASPSGLQDRVTNFGAYWPDYKFPFRFMENHDEDRYINGHTAQQTKTAATMLMTVPGIPMIYAGQEVGETSPRGLIQWDNDPHGMMGHYGKLLEARNRLKALRGDEQYWLNHDQGNRVYSYARRWTGEHPVVVALNLNSQQRPTNIDFNPGDFGIEAGEEYYLQDIISGSVDQVMGSDLENIFVDLAPYSSSVMVISDTLFVMDVPDDRTPVQQPREFSLHQNFPNPFNPSTQIGFTLPESADVRLAVYNVMGREVARLVDGRMSAGQHEVTFTGRDLNGRELASGVYFYRLEAGEFVMNRKMVLLK